MSSRPLDLNAYPDNGCDMVREDVQGKLPNDLENNTNNVEVHAKLPMEGENNSENVEPSRAPSLSVVLPTIYDEENGDLLDWQAAETLVLLSEGLARRL